MALVEYLIAREGVPSQHGVAYDYVLGGDGLYLRTHNRFLEVRVPVASANVRGLSPIYPSFELKTGRLPPVLWQQILTVAQAWATRGHEVMLVVTHDEVTGYQLYVPRQATSATRVIYERRDRTLLEIHSHHRFRARFSAVDDADEQRLCLYGVIGRLDDETPEVALRVGAYGYYLPLPWESVFTGEKRPFRDLVSEPKEAEVTYQIDSTPIPDETRTVQYQREATIVLVGCGGTGGFLADSICRLLMDLPADLYLVDPDRVEPHNVARQAFDRANVGHFKAEVLARRLAQRFGREIGYSVLPYDHELHAQVFGGMHSRLNLLVGCVDNAAARRAIAATIGSGPATSGMRNDRVWWLDCGNGRNAGQVLLGNATQSEGLRHAFHPQLGIWRALPAPSLQRPDLLETPPEPRWAPDCAEAIAQGDQGPTINQVVAAVAASYVEKLLAGTCCWMASYFDLDDGSLRCMPIDPRHVADIAALHLNAVAPRGRGGAVSA